MTALSDRAPPFPTKLVVACAFWTALIYMVNGSLWDAPIWLLMGYLIGRYQGWTYRVYGDGKWLLKWEKNDG